MKGNSDDDKKKEFSQSIEEFNSQLASLASISTDIANSTFDIVSGKLSNQIDKFFETADKEWASTWRGDSSDSSSSSSSNCGRFGNDGFKWNKHLGLWGRNGINYEEAMKNCEDNHGVSLWDQKGIWSCLLPSSQILTTNGKLISRDSIEESVSKKDAFLSFADFLRWRKQVRREEYERAFKSLGNGLQEKTKDITESLEGAKQEIKETFSSFSNFDTTNNNNTNDNLSDNKELKIVGNSKQTSIKSIDDNKFEKVSKISYIYSDGSVDSKEYRTIIDKNGSSVGVPTTTNDFNDNNSLDVTFFDDLKKSNSDSNSSFLSGWFWGGNGNK